MRHGTRATYNNGGCRCQECKRAHAAYTYARRILAGWDKPVVSASRLGTIRLPDGTTVPDSVLREALAKNDRSIKTDILLSIRMKGICS